MKKIGLFLWFLLFSFGLFCQNWRSGLYPSDWKKETNASFFTDKLLQDFSFAGYHRGEKDVPTSSTQKIYTVTEAPFNADATGKIEATDAIQKAINEAQLNGGGIVYIPKGTYMISCNDKGFCFLISSSNVIIRGAGKENTFLINNTQNMRYKAIFSVSNQNSWYLANSFNVPLTKDLLSPTTIIPVSSVADYAKGDLILIKCSINARWATDHQMTDYWRTSFPEDLIYCREILHINPITNEITIDIPIRYALKMTYDTHITKAPTMLSEVGIEELSIGNLENKQGSFLEEDYNVAGTGAYQCHASYVIYAENIRNSWIKNISTFKPESNAFAHILSNGIFLNNSKNVSILGCNFQKSQYGGAGGNGYMYRISANETLITHSEANFSRHGFVFAKAVASGNVLHKVKDSNSGKQTGSSGNEDTRGMNSDHHMHFSHSNLIDHSEVFNSTFESRFRFTGDVPDHALTAAHTCFWNINSNGNQSFSVWTEQAKYGYVIGTSGTKAKISTSFGWFNSSAITNPIDHIEGEGNGTNLVPQSLYLDQKAKRLNILPLALEDRNFILFPNPSTSIFYINQRIYFSLFTAMGQFIFSDTNTHFDLSNYPSGMYLFHSELGVRKLFLQK